jgi:hypothetical protein
MKLGCLFSRTRAESRSNASERAICFVYHRDGSSRAFASQLPVVGHRVRDSDDSNGIVDARLCERHLYIAHFCSGPSYCPWGDRLDGCELRVASRYSGCSCSACVMRRTDDVMPMGRIRFEAERHIGAITAVQNSRTTAPSLPAFRACSSGSSTLYPLSLPNPKHRRCKQSR